MVVSTTTNFLNPAKKNELLSQWYEENFLSSDYKRWQKQLVNYATMDEVRKFVFANKPDWEQQILDKNVEKISQQEFTMDKDDKFLRLIFFNSTHYFDVDNYQMLNNRDLFKNQLAINQQGVKTCVVFAGDLFGSEWKMQNFNNAKFSENKDGTRDIVYTSDEGKVVYYYGLKKRMQQLETDIWIALNSGAEVYLMRGAEEHEIYQFTGRNILKEVYEKINARLGDNNTIPPENLHYINESASLVVNMTRHKPDGSMVCGTIGLQTNNTDKAYTAQGGVNSANKSNGSLNCDIRFVSNANTVGNFSGTYYVSPQCVYYRTPHKKNPRHAPHDNNVFLLSLERPHQFDVSVGERVNNPTANLEYAEYKEKYKNNVLYDIAVEKLKRQQINLNSNNKNL